MSNTDIERLKNLRQELGFSQIMLAKYLGYSRNYITLIETGRRPLTKDIKDRIETVFNIRL
jgi:transcriptional regulator with XRE-family HTH domain